MRWSLRHAPLVFAVGIFAGCGKKVPAELKPTLDAIHPDARKVADLAAKACGELFTSGRFKVTPTGCSETKLPGETTVPVVPSPAKGTSLETNPLVLEVEVMCSAPQNANEGCGTSLGALHNTFRGPGAGRTRNRIDGNCKSSSTDCEEIVSPSQRAADEVSVDLRIVKPAIGGPPGSTAEVTITLAKK